MAIWSEPRPTRKSRSADALRKSADDPLILSTVARLFWAERKIEKARQWFERALTANSDLGDNWGWWLKFERQHGVAVRKHIQQLLCLSGANIDRLTCLITRSSKRKSSKDALLRILIMGQHGNQLRRI